MRSVAFQFIFLLMVLTFMPNMSFAWMSSLKMAESISQAKTMNEVMALLRKGARYDYMQTERLMIYDHIPKPLLDVTATLEKVHAEVVSPQDIPFVTEVVYLLELDVQLGSSFQRDRWLRPWDRKFLREELIKCFRNWKYITETYVLNELENNGKELTDSEKEAARKEARESFGPRLQSLSQALLSGLSAEQIKSLSNTKKTFTKFNNKDRRSDINRALWHRDMGYISLGILFGVLGGMTGYMGFSDLERFGVSPGLLLPFSFSAALDAIALSGFWEHFKEGHRARQSAKVSFNEREKLWDPLYTPVQENSHAARCSRTVGK